MTAGPSPAFLRLFIALAVPPEIRQAIGRAQSRLRREAPPGALRWTQPEQFHITLKFLGDVPTEQLEKVKQAATAVCGASPALQLSARGLGFFPNERKPRVLWAGAEDTAGALPDLHRRLDEALRWLAPDARPEKFGGHITLGRFKPGHHDAILCLKKQLLELRGRHFGNWSTAGVELVQSDLNSAGAEHTVIGTFSLVPQ